MTAISDIISLGIKGPQGQIKANMASSVVVMDDGVTSLPASLHAMRAALAEKAGKGELVKLNNTVTSTSTTEAATAKAVKTAYDKAVEAKAAADAALLAAGQDFIAGGIVPFSGAFGGSDGKRPIPRGASVAHEGWALCDGSNGTPDLRDRFIVGAGGKYAKDSKGGNETHGHSMTGSVGSATLSEYQMPSHKHALISAGDGGYTATGLIVGGNGVSTRYGGCFTINAQAMGATGSSGSHSHSLSASAAAASGLPPYYALSYIMKL